MKRNVKLCKRMKCKHLAKVKMKCDKELICSVMCDEAVAADHKDCASLSKCGKCAVLYDVPAGCPFSLEMVVS